MVCIDLKIVILIVTTFSLLCHSTEVKEIAKDSLSQSESNFQDIQSAKKSVGNDFVRTRHPSMYIDVINGFLPTIYVIVISELGDKTFFIAAIMSIRNSRWIVYLGAMSALTAMTILSALLGFATTVVPRKLTWFLSGSLFAVFGVKMLKDAYDMTPEDSEEEYNEVKEDIKRRDATYLEDNRLETDAEIGLERLATVTPSTTPTKMNGFKRLIYALFTKVFVEAFILTFLAEWGDRSQISTIILGATKNVIGVILGGVLGHGICTGLAVIGGRIISQKIPVKWLTFAGGITFIAFSIHTFYIGPDALS